MDVASRVFFDRQTGFYGMRFVFKRFFLIFFADCSLGIGCPDLREGSMREPSAFSYQDMLKSRLQHRLPRNMDAVAI